VVGVSTDKACQPDSIYGYSKKIMEQIFVDHHCATTNLVCARFANVACSSGSVIPYWIDCAKNNKTLQLTDSRMNRLMFTPQAASKLIMLCIEYVCREMKSVGMLHLANQISTEFGNGEKPDIVGMRAGEKLNETLVAATELHHAFYTEESGYIMLQSDEFGNTPVTQPLSSLSAEYMCEDEMRQLYAAYTESPVSLANGQ